MSGQSKVDELERILLEGHRGAYPSNRELTYTQFCDVLKDFKKAVSDRQKERDAEICEAMYDAGVMAHIADNRGNYMAKANGCRECADAIRTQEDK